MDVTLPPGLAGRLEHKLCGYDWNLAEPTWCTFRVHEIHPGRSETWLLSGPDGFSCRFAEGERASLVLPMRKPREVTALVTLCPVESGTRASLHVGGARVLDVALKPGWQTYTFKVPAARLRAGINYLTVEQRLPPPRTWPIGTTGRRIELQQLANSDVSDLWTDDVFLYVATRMDGIHIFLIDPECGGL